MVSVAFSDGHVKAMKLSRMDDFNNDVVPDNGYYDGCGEADNKFHH